MEQPGWVAKITDWLLNKIELSGTQALLASTQSILSATGLICGGGE